MSACISFLTTGELADIEQRLAKDLRWVVAEHGVRASNLHPFILERPYQSGHLAVTLKGVTA